jgi:glycosyltransferase involved in cell wall biosynthesis
VVVGDGPDRARLAAIAGPNVELRGRVDDDELDRLYAACDAVIHPAIDDFGIVPVEALAAGRPVIAFAEGGARDSVRDAETGVLFTESTPEALGKATQKDRHKGKATFVDLLGLDGAKKKADELTAAAIAALAAFSANADTLRDAARFMVARRR